MTTESPAICSFCGKRKEEVAKLIVSDSVAICNDCVDFCQDLLSKDQQSDRKTDNAVSTVDPHELKQFLDQHIIGQTQAKITISVAIANHYKRINNDHDDLNIDKANILMVGSTGSGKTLLAKTVARYLDVPFVIGDATSVTEAGYVGDDVETLITRLYNAAGHDVEKTQRGIIYIDEIDKIARKSDGASISRDVSGEGVQQALLKIVEGTQCRIPVNSSRKHPNGETVEIDTSNILFIAGGAFIELDAVIKHREKSASMGFSGQIGSGTQVLLDALKPEDLVKYGMIPEFVGRFPAVVKLDQLTHQDLIGVLTQTQNNLIDQYKWLFSQDNIDLEFESDAIRCIVDRAEKTGTGARALHSEIERVLLPHMYNIRLYQQSQKTVKITSELVNNPTSLEE